MIRVYSESPTQIDLKPFHRAGVGFNTQDALQANLSFHLVNQSRITTTISLPKCKENADRLTVLLDKPGRSASRLWVCERTPWFTVCGPVKSLDFEDLLIVVEFKVGDFVPQRCSPINDAELPCVHESISSCMTVTAPQNDYSKMKGSVIFGEGDFVIIPKKNPVEVQRIAAKWFFS